MVERTPSLYLAFRVSFSGFVSFPILSIASVWWAGGDGGWGARFLFLFDFDSDLFSPFHFLSFFSAYGSRPCASCWLDWVVSAHHVQCSRYIYVEHIALACL